MTLQISLSTIFVQAAVWFVYTSSCSGGMKGTTTTKMTGRKGNTLSILSSDARARNHTHEYYVLGSEALPKSCRDPAFSFKRFLVLYHLCYNSFCKTKIVNTASYWKGMQMKFYCNRDNGSCLFEWSIIQNHKAGQGRGMIEYFVNWQVRRTLVTTAGDV